MVEKALAAMVLVFISATALAQSSTSMPRADHAAIKAACTDLVLDYAYYRDRSDALGFANVFAPDGELRVMGQVFIGRKALHDRLANGGDGPVYRHMMSTIRIFPKSPREATGVSYVTVYSAPAGTGPAQISNFAAVGEYHDEFVLTDTGWKIARREFVPVFLPPDS